MDSKHTVSGFREQIERIDVDHTIDTIRALAHPVLLRPSEDSSHRTRASIENDDKVA